MINIQKLLFPTGKQHPLYLQYVGWSTASNILVSAQTVLAAHSVLAAVDIGHTDAMRTANYIGKDILGQLGSLLAMSKMGEQVDKDPRKFLEYAHIYQQFSYGMVCITPLCPTYFLPIAGLGNVMANLGFTGIGAVNYKCINRLALEDNGGELYAKITVMSTLGSTVGMGMGIALTVAVPDHSLRLCLIPIIGAARVYCFNKAIEGLI